MMNNQNELPNGPVVKLTIEIDSDNDPDSIGEAVYDWLSDVLGQKAYLIAVESIDDLDGNWFTVCLTGHPALVSQLAADRAS